MGIGLFINLKYERTRSESVRKLIKKIICIFFFIGLLAGQLFAFGNKSLKAPQADKKSKNVINMQEYYDNLSDMVPAIIFLSPDSTTGISDELLELLDLLKHYLMLILILIGIYIYEFCQKYYWHDHSYLIITSHLQKK